MIQPTDIMAPKTAPWRGPERAQRGVFRRLVLTRLESLREGRLIIDEGNDTATFGSASLDTSLTVTVRVHDPRFYRHLLLGGSLGAAEAYLRRYWDADDLTALVRLFVRNRAVLDGVEGGLASFSVPWVQLVHWLHRNTLGGSRKNIAAHYDLGNDFFELFLDESLMYSCAIFDSPEASLEAASRVKIDRICRKLQLASHDHLLEIGTGWGGFALHAASQYGCRVTTTTLSQQQYALARQRVQAAGLGDRITVLRQDYRELRGRFDKLVSIEMIEAVGHQYLDDYFAACSRLLKPDGMLLLQAITIADQHYERAKGSVDFIKHYVFPGSCIPSVSAIMAAVARASDLRLFHLEDIGAHYVTTLQGWRERFQRNRPRIQALGYSERLLRTWDFYFGYCEGGFAERFLGDVQMLLVKPLCRRQSLVLPFAAAPSARA